MITLVLHLRPGAREWFARWLGLHHPHLVRRFATLYAEGAHAPTCDRRRVTRLVHDLAAEYGIGPAAPFRGRASRPYQPCQAAPTARTARPRSN